MGTRDGRCDFDFLFGRWEVRNLQLKEFAPTCEAWREFTTSCTAQPTLGGLGNIDFFSFAGDAERPPWEASTVRLYEPARDTWRIYWASSAHPGPLGEPMVGRFSGGVGEFYGEDAYRGGRLGVRFFWTRHGTEAARWEQAYRFPDEEVWRPNWIMEFGRVGGGS